MTGFRRLPGAPAGDHPGGHLEAVPSGHDLGDAEASTVVHAAAGRGSLARLAPVVAALSARKAFTQAVVHTGHAHEVPRALLAELGAPAPDRYLAVEPGARGAYTGRVLAEFERTLTELRAALVVVSGDGDATLACALAAAKLGVPVARLGGGLRSGDRTDPRELNRVLVDRLADTLFTHSAEAGENLALEGIASSAVHHVGNTAIDSLRRCEREARARAAWRTAGLDERGYMLVSLREPRNVDDPQRLAQIVDALAALGRQVPVAFPPHPRARAALERHGALERLRNAGIACPEPVGYLEFVSLMSGAGAVVSDAGAIGDEASALGVACFMLGARSERSGALTHGTGVLLGDDPADLAALRPSPHPPTPAVIALWDGRAAERVATVLVANYALTRSGAGPQLWTKA